MTRETPREAAYLALLDSLRGESFASESIERWEKRCNPSPKDRALAREIAFGSIRMALALDYIGSRLTPKQKLHLKLKEKALFRMAIYQRVFMDRVPLYAIINESIEVGKKYCHETFIRFLNATLRKLSDPPPLPEGKSAADLSIRYSYPVFYVKELIRDYGEKVVKALLEEGNQAAPTLFRVRPGGSMPEVGVERWEGTSSLMGVIRDPALLPRIAASPSYYIQNATPVDLIHTLSQGVEVPGRILDLCASPGGKLVAAHDHFPQAALFANDVSEEKLRLLSENCDKYGIEAELSSVPGETFFSPTPFDLVIVDAPCSNTGVLNKRPEARWRLSPSAMKQLEETQLKLIQNAATLIHQEGEVWYITCSLLKRENERLVKRACLAFSLFPRLQKTILPNGTGWDGGFACALRKGLLKPKL